MYDILYSYAKNDSGEQKVEKSQVTILGARGSMPVSGPEYSEYGGATSCVLLETGEQAIVFDAGSGFLKLPPRVWREHTKVHVFLSHAHLDHLLGLMMCPMMYDETAEVIFYAKEAEKFPAVFRQMMAEPLWPVGPETFQARVRYHSMDANPVVLKEAGAQPVTVRAMSVTHPGGALAFRAEWGVHRVVYATDCEPDAEERRLLERFAADCELFILDAQYTDEEAEGCRGFGHPSMRTAAQIIAGSGAGKGLFFHHAPTHTDTQLRQMEICLQQYREHISYAREGEVVEL